MMLQCPQKTKKTEKSLTLFVLEVQFRKECVAHHETKTVIGKNGINPRPVGLWRVTHCVCVGGVSSPPLISQTTGLISKIQTHSIALFMNVPSMV